MVYLNHDNAFQRVFINSSVTKLAEALLAYHRLIAEAQAANGADAYLDGNVPPESLRKFVSLITTLDPPALERGLWAQELEQLQGRAGSAMTTQCNGPNGPCDSNAARCPAGR